MLHVARPSYSALSQILPIFAKASYADSRTLHGVGCPSRASPAPWLRRARRSRPTVVGKPAVSDAATGYCSFNLLSFDLPLVRLWVIIPKLTRGVGHSAPVFGQTGQVVSTHSGQDLQGLQIRCVIASIRVDDRHGMTHFFRNRRRRTAVATRDDKIISPGRRQAPEPNVADLSI